MKLLLVHTGPHPSYVRAVEKEGFLLETATNYMAAGDKCGVYFYDVVLIDLPVPDNGLYELLATIKRADSHTGIIMASDPVQVQTKIELLMAGADDYLVRPFEPGELAARARTLVRRCTMEGRQSLEHRGVRIEPSTRHVSCKGTPVTLTRKEYELLFFFLRNPEKILTHEAIAEYLWGDFKGLSADCFDFIYSHIKNIREKLAGAGTRHFIDTVYGVGYVVR
ncbi:MAG: response regulator transcription factor [Rikenellaceae bacterium]|nr:response regulator transcription factor [Rikenellaceae bacterium]